MLNHVPYLLYKTMLFPTIIACSSLGYPKYDSVVVKVTNVLCNVNVGLGLKVSSDGFVHYKTFVTLGGDHKHQ